MFVTLKSLVPGTALLATLILAVTTVELTQVVEWTVIPAPNEAVAPFEKLVPLMVMSSFEAPWPRELGVLDVTLGAAAATLKQAEHDLTPWSGFVTRMSQGPGAASLMSKVPRI